MVNLYPIRSLREVVLDLLNLLQMWGQDQVVLVVYEHPLRQPRQGGRDGSARGTIDAVTRRMSTSKTLLQERRNQTGNLNQAVILEPK